MQNQYLQLLVILFFITSCDKISEENTCTKNNLAYRSLKSTLAEYIDQSKEDSKKSSSLGSVSNGKLLNGKLFPFYGNNFQYFDTLSYLHHRAYTHQLVRKTLIDTYNELEHLYPNKTFFVMELSNKEGGKIFPHRTHQNGLSVDLMSPKLKKGKANSDLDNLGQLHYLLEFDQNGILKKNRDYSIDFNLISHHLLLLDKNAKKNQLKIKKVIFKKELKDELYASQYGTSLKSSNIYITKNLPSYINDLHDDHYHIDFSFITD